MKAAVFTPRGRLVAGKRSAPFDVLASHLNYARAICDATVEFEPFRITIDLILMLPGTGFLPLPAHLLSPLVGCLDEGGIVAVRGRDLNEVDAAAEQILLLVGGTGHV